MIQNAVDRRADGQFMYACYRTTDGIRRVRIGCTHLGPREAIAHADRLQAVAGISPLRTSPLPGHGPLAVAGAHPSEPSTRDEPQQPVSPAERDAHETGPFPVASAAAHRGSPDPSTTQGRDSASPAAASVVVGHLPLPAPAMGSDANTPVPLRAAGVELIAGSGNGTAGPARTG